jgi:NADP-dependent 3-hydroxy acid dehydrogenase YdfG
MKLQDQTAIITGAGRGIGRAIATTLAEEGALVILVARTGEELQEVAEQCEQRGGRAHAIVADLTSESDIRRIVGEVREKFGRIDILVNNAGIGRFGPVRQLALGDFDAMWNLNVRAAFLLTQLTLPLMESKRSGIIVNVASLAGKNAFVNGAGYAATKWALRAFAQCLMLEEREFNIRVVTVCPGSVDTTFSSRTAAAAKRDWVIQPEDVAATVLMAVTMPARTMVSEIDIRPTNPK